MLFPSKGMTTQRQFSHRMVVADEADGLGGSTPAVVAAGVELSLGAALEAIGAEAVLELLLTERLEDVGHGLFDSFVVG